MSETYPILAAEQWAERINASWQKTVAGILETAKLVVAALEECAQEDLAERVVFSTPVLSMLTKVGRDGRLLLHVKELPPSYATLYQIAQLDDEQFERAATGGGKGGKPLLRPDVERSEVIAFRRVAEKQSAPPLPEGKYRVLYADPPWEYGDRREGLARYPGATTHYPTMSSEELENLPTVELAGENAVLFLWATSPLLPVALSVMKAWGFVYKSSFVWDKVKHNPGHYNSVRHELLLIGTRGSCLPDVSELIDSVQSIERGEHSAKPEEFRQIIDRLYVRPLNRIDRIELFRRGAAPEGWAAWGAETV